MSEEINQFDATLNENLENFMEAYKMVDVDEIYSNGTEFVPIFRVKQWLDYNNIKDLQQKVEQLEQALKNSKDTYDDVTYEMSKKIEQLENIRKEAIEYMEQAIHSDSSTKLPSGKITDIGYCIVAFEDLLNILNKGSDKE